MIQEVSSKMATRSLHILLLTVITATTAQQSVMLYSYPNDEQNPVCLPPVDVIILMSDYDGLSTHERAYPLFYANILEGLDLRQQGTISLAVVLTSSVYPSNQEVGYTLQLLGSNNVTATPILNNAQATPLPALLERIRIEIMPKSGPSQKILLFFTDEVSELDIDGTMLETRLIRDAGVTVAGITSSNTKRVLAVLEEMTGDPNRVFSYDSAWQMAQDVRTILNSLCNSRTQAGFTSPTTLEVQTEPTQQFVSPTTDAVRPPQPPTAPPPIAPGVPPAAPTTFPPFPPAGSNVILVSPSFGPESGGTVITLVGDLLQQQFLLIRISSLTCTVVSQYEGTIKCQTSSRSSSSVPVNQPLDIVLVPSSGDSISIPQAFTYRPDPSVFDIYPLSTIVSGGLLVTVTGNNLDSVGDASLIINVKSGGVIRQSFTETCIARTTTNIFCPTAKITYPEVAIRNSRSRVKRQAIPGLVNNGNLDFTVGVQLDGLSLYNDFKPLDVYIDPYIYQFEKSPYQQIAQNSIDIKGANLTLALKESDYSVFVGDANCEIERLVTNTITCKPERKPSASSKGLDGTYAVHVTVGTGNLQFYVGGLMYSSNLWRGTWPIVAAGLGAAGLLLAILVIIILSCCKNDS